MSADSTVEQVHNPSLPAAPGGAAPAEVELPLTVIESGGGWKWIDLGELWAYRELLYFFTWRDVKVRYKQTVLGALWAVLQPFTMMLIFTAVLGQAPGAKSLPVPYNLFVFSGLMAWTLFGTALTGAANSMIESERLITKIAFPRLLMPASAIGPALVDFAVSGLVLLALLLWYGVALSWTAPLAVLGLGVMLIAVIGAGSLLAALNVMFRDFRYTTTFLMQAWMFATPAIYIASFGGTGGGGAGDEQPATRASNLAQWFVLANPLNGAIAFFRAALFGWPLPWAWLGGAAILAVAMLGVGLTYFRRTEDSFADVI